MKIMFFCSVFFTGFCSGPCQMGGTVTTNPKAMMSKQPGTFVLWQFPVFPHCFFFSLVSFFRRRWDIILARLLKQHLIITKAAKNSSYANTLMWSRFNLPSVCSPAHVPHTLLFQQWILELYHTSRHTPSHMVSYLLLQAHKKTLASVKEGITMLSLTKLWKAASLALKKEVKYSFNKFKRNTPVK